MTWTYDAEIRIARNRVRERCGDTDTGNQQLADEIIDDELEDPEAAEEDRPEETNAAIACVRKILAKMAPDTSRSAIGISTELDQRVAHYLGLLEELKAEQGGGAKSYVGGISRAEKAAALEDTDFPRPAFSVGMGRNYGS